MGVRNLAMDASRIDLVLAINGDKILRVRLEALKVVHPIHGLRENGSGGMPRHAIIPGRPGKPSLGHDVLIAVHRRKIRLVLKGPEQAALVGIGIGEQAQ